MKLLLSLLAAVTLCGCVNTVQNGAVCFTFDDFDRKGWVEALPLFQKYDAKASFFFSGRIDASRIEVMKKLQAAGHTVGLHSVRHTNAAPLKKGDSIEQYFKREIQPQLDICRTHNIKVRAFAYPNNRRTEETDKYLYQYFDFLRAGYGGKTPVYVPMAEVMNKMVLRGGGIGKYYNSRLDDLISRLDYAADNNQLAVFFSHRIQPGAKSVHIDPELLEALLFHARKRNMLILGAEDLADLKR